MARCLLIAIVGYRSVQEPMGAQRHMRTKVRNAAESARSAREESELDTTGWAAMGRAATLYAHDACKQLAVLRVIARKLREGSSDVSRSAGEILELADAVTESLAQIVSAGKDEMVSADTGEVELGRAVDLAVANVARVRRNCSIEVEVSKSFGRVKVPRLLVPVVENLLDNGVLAGDPFASVVVTATAWSGSLVLEIKDDGNGVSRDALNAARAGRVGCTKRPLGAGEGVGLALAMELTALLGGELDLFPQSPQGTRAVVSLPIASLKV